MSRIAALAALLCSGCYLTHGAGGPPAPGLDAGTPPGFDAGPPPRFDAGTPPRFDAGPGRRDAGFDAGRDAGDPTVDAGCVLPVAPHPDEDVCREATGECIADCGDSQLCIVSCLQRDEPCRICSVRNALSCFNDTPCERFYPSVSCCIVESCAATTIDDVLNVCTAIACEDVFREYADCAVARARRECREAVARCGVPPNLLGLD